MASLSSLRVVVMGVSGSGKSTVGEQLADVLGVEYLDGDVLHPKANVDKMAAGFPLDDDDRRPWLEDVGRHLAAHPSGLVIGCSALKRSYRDIIRSYAPGTRFVHLVGDFDLLYERMKTRPGHFMPPDLLNSQFDTLEPLEPDEDGKIFDVADPPEDIAATAAQWLRRTGAA